jgi:hypothetical protein
MLVVARLCLLWRDTNMSIIIIIIIIIIIMVGRRADRSTFLAEYRRNTGIGVSVSGDSMVFGDFSKGCRMKDIKTRRNVRA